MAALKHPRDYFADYQGLLYIVYVPVYWSSVGHRQWDSYDAGFPKLPAGFVMRHWNLKSADGKRRRNFPCSRRWDDVAVPMGATITLPNADGTSTVWTIVGYNSERYQPRRYVHKRR